MYSRFFVSAVLCAVLAGCSVKEDREACPCALALVIDTGIADKDSGPIHLIIGDSISQELSFEDCKEEHFFNVRKGIVQVSACLGCKSPCFEIDDGEEFPPVFSAYRSIDASSDVARDTLRLSKNYCMIDVSIFSSDNAAYDISLNSSVCGYGSTGEILLGDYCVEKTLSQGKCFFIVPRQKDNSLKLILEAGENLKRNFPLGEYLDASGYDWTSVNLRDIEIVIDYADITLDPDVKIFEKERTVSLEL